MADDSALNEKLLLATIRQPMADEFNWDDFLSIGFTHHIEILSKTKSLDARFFYIHECATRFWNKYTLRDYLKADLYENKGSLPNNFTQTISNKSQAIKAINTFKDEYLLDFINIEELNEQEEDINERVIEKAIVANVKKFIMTFGQDFIYIGNQYPIEYKGRNGIVDLLFFHRGLRSLIAIELKAGRYKPEYAGKMNYYLSILDRTERGEDENPSIGIILCAEKNHVDVELSLDGLDKPIGVADYRLIIPQDDLKQIIQDEIQAYDDEKQKGNE